MVARSDVQEPKTPNSPDLPAVNVPVVEVPSAEVLVPGNEPSTPTEPPGLEAPALQEPDVPDPLPTLTIVWRTSWPLSRSPKSRSPLWTPRTLSCRRVGVSVQEIPDIPEPTVPELSSRPIPPAFDLPDPGHGDQLARYSETGTSGPADRGRTCHTRRQGTGCRRGVCRPPRTDDRVAGPPEDPDPEDPDPGHRGGPPCPRTQMPAHWRGSSALSVGGEARVVVELDGYAIGETLFRTWNRRTGGALNG